MTWQWFAVDPPSGAVTAELTTARERRVTWRLDAPGDAEFNLKGYHGDWQPTEGDPPDQTSEVGSLTKDLLITWNQSSTFGMRARIGPSDMGIGDTVTETWKAVDYRGVLARHYARSALSYVGADRGDIIRALVAHARSGENSTFNIGIGDIDPSTPTDLNVDVGKSLGEQADELAGIYPGFDLWTDADMLIHARTRGVLRDFVLEYPTTVSHVSRSFDPSVYGNTVIGTGADGSTVPAVEYAPDLASRPEGRWELVASNPDISTQPALNASTQQALLRGAASGVSHTFTLKPGVWTPDLLWLGDLVPYRYETHTRSVDALDRVYEITVTDDGNGTPQAAVKVGNRLTSDLAVMQRRIVMTLNKLARR